MKRLYIKLVFLLLTAPAFQVPAQKVTYYVSPGGSGGACSVQKPCSLEGIREKLRNRAKTDTADIIVYLKGRTYRLEKPFEIGPEMAGNEKGSLTFTSAPGEKAFLSGGEEVTGWTGAGNGLFKAKVPAGFDFRQLYVNGKMAVRARTPNREDNADYGPYNRVQRFDRKNLTVVVKASELPSLRRNEGFEMVINHHWYQSRVRIASLERMKDSIVLTPHKPEQEHLFQLTYSRMLEPDKPYYFENAFEFLDAEDEWYLDKEQGWLYYKPRAGQRMQDLRVVAPRLETLVLIAGTANEPVFNVTVSGIDLGYGTWLSPSKKGAISTQGVQPRGYVNDPGPGLLQLEFARSARIENCYIFGAGAHGIVLTKGVKNSSIVSNHIDQISANGMMIDTHRKGIQPDSLLCSSNRVANNLIENVGMHYTPGMGLLASYIEKHIIEHNEIRFGRYTGIQLGNHHGDNLGSLRDNYIRYNNIHHVMQLHDDGGAIYTLSNQPGTKIYQNWIHDYGKNEWADNYPVNGIFLDNNSAYILVEDNVFTNLKTVDMLKENTGTRVHDNTFRNNGSQIEEVKRNAGIIVHDGWHKAPDPDNTAREY